MKIQPLNNNILVKEIKSTGETTTESGIIITGNVKEGNTITAEIVEVSPFIAQKEELVPGVKIITAIGSGLGHDGYKLLQEKEILATLS